MSDIIKKDDKPVATLQNGKLRFQGSKFQQRINASRAEAFDPQTAPNRLCLMLDQSSSMNGIADWHKNNVTKIDLLKRAVECFIERSNLSDTAIAIETFPSSKDGGLPLTNVRPKLWSFAQALSAEGNTPMLGCVTRTIQLHAITRAVLVSDGEATDWRDVYVAGLDDGYRTSSPNDILRIYHDAGIPIDCVHIGDSSSGEDRLRHIAKATGGVYIKFTDVSAFSTAFGYLTPGYRAMLTSGRISAEDLGASEVKL